MSTPPRLDRMTVNVRIQHANRELNSILLVDNKFTFHKHGI